MADRSSSWFPKLLPSLPSRVKEAASGFCSSLKDKFKNSRPRSSPVVYTAAAGAGSASEMIEIAVQSAGRDSTIGAAPTTGEVWGFSDTQVPMLVRVNADHTPVGEEKAAEKAKRSLRWKFIRAFSSLRWKSIGKRSMSSSASGAGRSVPILYPGEAAEGEAPLTINTHMSNNTTTTTAPQQRIAGIRPFDHEADIAAGLPPHPEQTATEGVEEEEDKPFYLRVRKIVAAFSVSYVMAGIAFTLYIKANVSFSSSILRSAYYFFAGVDYIMGASLLVVVVLGVKAGIVQVVLLGVGFFAIIVDASLVVFTALPHDEFALIYGALLAIALAAGLCICGTSRNS